MLKEKKSHENRVMSDEYLGEAGVGKAGAGAAVPLKNEPSAELSLVITGAQPCLHPLQRNNSHQITSRCYHSLQPAVGRRWGVFYEL